LRHESYFTMLCLDCEPSFLLLPRFIERIQNSFVSAFRVLTRIPILPFDKFVNIDKIGQVRSPVLVIHGKADEVVHFWHGEQLFATANEPKVNFWVDGAGHNDLMDVAGARYAATLRKFAKLVDESS